MNLIDNLSQEPTQVTNVVLEDGTVAVITLTYRPTVQRWVFNVLRGTFQANGLNLCVNPNMLREWRNVIDFGLMCLTTDGLDPFLIDDFTSGRAQLYVLNQADVTELENTAFASGVLA